MWLDETMATNDCGCRILVDADYDFVDECCHDSGERPRTAGCRDIKLVIGHGIIGDFVWCFNGGATISNCESELALELTDEAVRLYEAGVRPLRDGD